MRVEWKSFRWKCICTFAQIIQTHPLEKIILITGATSGFGMAIAEEFAAHGWNLIITGRREERLKVLQEELQKKIHVSGRTALELHGHAHYVVMGNKTIVYLST